MIALAGCGSIGTPVVVEETTSVGTVEIVSMDANSIRAANATEYAPRTLPAIFARTTGTASSVRGVGGLPEPSFSAQDRPASLATRLPPAYTPGNYEIGVGDVVVISVPQTGSTVAELTGLLAAQNGRTNYTVQDDGAVAIPDVGRVEIAGLNLEEAQGVLFSALVDNQIDPSFSLEIAEFNSQRVSIGGAVGTPGVVPMTLTPLRLSEALNSAGGISVPDLDFASIRLYRDGSLFQIPLNAYLETPSIQRIMLKDGDNIYVDTEYNLDQATGYFQQQINLQTARSSIRESALDQLATELSIRRNELNEARDNFTQRVTFDAVDRDYVYIAGEVEQQSRYTLPFERKAHLADALFDTARGVPNATGNIGEVYVLRANEDGRGITAWHLNAYNAANLVLATRFELRPDDVIFVSEKPLTAVSRVMAQVATSVALLIP